MALLHQWNEVLGSGLLQHTQRPDYIRQQQRLHGWQRVHERRVYLHTTYCTQRRAQKGSFEGYIHQYLAKELFSFAGLEVQSGKSHEQIAKLGGAVVLTLCCVVLVGKVLEVSQTSGRRGEKNNNPSSTDLCKSLEQRKVEPLEEAQ